MYTINVKLFDGKISVMKTDGTNKIINFKRQIIKTLYDSQNSNKMFVHEIYLSAGTKIFQDTEIIGEIFEKNDYNLVELMLRLSSGPKNIRNQKLSVGGDILFKIVKIKFSPTDLVKYVVDYMIEVLCEFDNYKDLTSHDIILSYNGLYLNPGKYFAEYSDLSQSFIKFNKQEKIYNEASVKGNLVSELIDYYQVVYVGCAKDKYPKLVVSIKDKKGKQSDMVDDLHVCKKCSANWNISFVTPCCRIKLCDNCLDVKCCEI